MHFGWFIAIVFLVFITFLICWGFCHHYLNRNKTRKSGKRREGIRLLNKHSLQRVFNTDYIHFISAGECNSNGRLLILSVVLPPFAVWASTRKTSRGSGRGCSSLSKTVLGRGSYTKRARTLGAFKNPPQMS